MVSPLALSLSGFTRSEPGKLNRRCFRHQLLLGGQTHCRNTKTYCPERFEEQILQRQKNHLR
jgi:hypothetical protein